MSKKKPYNILWIQTDEQRTDSLGCYGNRWIRTPNLDALAARGTVFRNHHVQSPICVPSRVCELTSCYPHQTGILENSVHYNWGKWPEGLVTFPELFAANGYVTANFGKYHTPHHPTWQENWHFEMFGREATHTRLESDYDDQSHEIIRLDGLGVILSGKYPQVPGGRTPQTHVVDTAIDWLELYAHVRRPFLLRVSFLAPHTPVLAPEPFYSLYPPEEMEWDVPTEDILESRPDFELDDRKREAYRAQTPGNFKRMRSTYYGLVSHIDQQVGRLIEELEKLGELDRTILVFSSDHGNLMGEYGQFQKGMFYDITTRVPLILAGPGVPCGTIQEDLSEAIDLGPTLLALAGIPAAKQMKGRNLFGNAPPREDVIGEICDQSSGRLIRRSWIRTKQWSLDYTSEIDGKPTHTRAERDGKLIDLVHDPLEHGNLYDDPAYGHIVEELTGRFEGRTFKDSRPVQIGGPNSGAGE